MTDIADFYRASSMAKVAIGSRVRVRVRVREL